LTRVVRARDIPLVVTTSSPSLLSWILSGRWDPSDRPPPPRVEPADGGYFRLTLGPLLLMVLTPFLAEVLWVVVYHHGGSAHDFIRDFDAATFAQEFPRPSLTGLRTVLAWALFQAVLLWTLPGARFVGPVTPKGNQPVYRRNGVLAWAVSHGAVLLGVYTGALDPVAFWRDYGSMLVVLNLGALLLCALLYWKGRRWPSTTDARYTGHLPFDFFQGVELHLTLFGADVKQLINCRISMMGWSVSVVLFACAQWRLTGQVTWAMLACVAVTVVYLLKFFVWETGYFRSLDIMHDHFGYYICWGVLCWVPSVYCLPGMYIAQRRGDLHPVVAVAIVALGLLSIAVNYAADEQRQRVRDTGGRTTIWGRKPQLIHARYRGPDGEERTNLLLASGYWGIARHFHYVPEIMLALAWTLPAGVEHALPYFYVFFLTILLVDRARRDDGRCRKKYGEDWEEYCRRVRWKILPGIY
jgi:7-dehydrocholesterol reductase